MAIPFAPFLAFGAVVALFAGDAILDWYLASSLAEGRSLLPARASGAAGDIAMPLPSSDAAQARPPFCRYLVRGNSA